MSVIYHLASEVTSLLCVVFFGQIQDMVMIRHAGSSTADLRTTLILLCEDGSLRIFMASVDHTNFWMVPTVQSGLNLAMEGGTAKLERKKKLTQTGELCSNSIMSVWSETRSETRSATGSPTSCGQKKVKLVRELLDTDKSF